MLKKRTLLLTFITLLLAFGLYQVYVFYFDNNDNIQPIYLVPKDAVYLLETQKPIDTWSSISESDIWQHLNTNAYFNNIAKNLNKLDTIFKQKQGLFEKIGNRELLISAHTYTPKKYSFLYIIDLKKIAKLKLIKNHLNTIIKNGFKVSKRKYHNHEITEVYNTKTHETLYISFIKNQMIVSFVHTIIEASIDQYLEPEIGRNLNFIEVKKQVAYNDMFRLYFQYKYLNDFIKVFSNKTSNLTSTLNNNLEFSGFSFNLKENTIIANGATNTNNKTSSYLKAIQKSGENKRTVSKIAPKNTALYLSFTFDSFNEFYTNFESIQKQNPEKFKSYLDGTEQIENLLKINLKKDFMSWIGSEVAILYLNSAISLDKKDTALVLKIKNNEQAINSLSFILEQIRKRTPVKFKAINYKGYTINYMAIKGFFKIILGNLFKDIDKPYFTIIEDYIVFSNHPNTLKSVINNYINNETLDYFDAFKTFNSKFKKQSSIFTYINTPNLYNSTYSFLDNTTKKQLKTNKDYFICFPQIGIQFTPYKSYFESKIIIDYETPKQVKENYTFNDTLNNAETNNNSNNTKEIPANITENSNEATIFNIPEIYPTDLTAKEFMKKDANGNVLFSVELKNGLKHGRYKGYYPNGSIKISGKYRKDKQSGTWRAYNLNEDIVFKKRF